MIANVKEINNNNNSSFLTISKNIILCKQNSVYISLTQYRNIDLQIRSTLKVH